MLIKIFITIYLITNTSSEFPNIRIGRIISSIIDWNFKNHDLFCPLKLYFYENSSDIVQIQDIPQLITKLSLVSRNTIYVKNVSEMYRRHNTFCSTVCVNDNDNNMDMASILKSSRPKKDYYIILANDISTLRIIFQSLWVKRVKLKIGIVSQSPQSLFTDPYIYSGDMIEHSFGFGLPVYLKPDWINLNGRSLLVTSTDLNPYVTLDGREILGSHAEIYKKTAQNFNLTIKIDVDKSRPVGIRTPNGTWIGMFGDILSEKADIAAWMGYLITRYPLVDYTTYTHIDNMIFVTLKPRILAVKWQAMLYPFSSQVWLLLLLSFVLITPVFYYTSLKNQKNPQIKPFYKAFNHSFGVLIEQSIEIEHGSRFASLVWILFTIIILTGYRSNLISFLTFPEIEKIPQDFVQLYQRTEYGIKYHFTGGIGYMWFNSSQNTMIRGLFKRFNLEKSAEECVLNAFVQEKWSCIGWSVALAQAIAKRLTLKQSFEPVYTSQSTVYSVIPAVVLRKNSIYTDAFSRIVGFIRDTGHFHKWNGDLLKKSKTTGQRELEENSHKSKSKSPEYLKLQQVLESSSSQGIKPFTMDNFILSFIILGIGLCLATVSFLWEKYLLKILKNSQDSRPSFVKKGVEMGSWYLRNYN